MIPVGGAWDKRKTKMTECCGRECETPFCPSCGSATGRHNLLTLLKHCQTNESRLKSRLQMVEESQAKEPTCRREKYIANRRELVAKWQHWIEGLEEVIARSSEK